MDRNEDSAITAPKWIKLDHAANIYPATFSRRRAAMFRLSVTLTEDVDPVVLQDALEATMPRFPSFGCRLRAGMFWNYLEHIQTVPIIQEDAQNPMISIGANQDRNYLFRVRYFRRQIAVEFFHALTDGTGGLTFLLTLVSAYLWKKYGIPQETGLYVLNLTETPRPEESEDSFPRYRGKIGSIKAESRAYHVHGTIIASHLIHVITGILPLDAVERAARKYNCSITVFLAAVMLLALEEQQETESRRKRVIRVSVPIDLRRRFPSNTLRNFSSWINVGINAQYGHYTLEEIIRILQAQMQIGLNIKELCANFTGTMSAASYPLFRPLPLFLKHWILNIGDALAGDASCSQNLSNLGQIEVPNAMRPYLRDIRFLLGRSRGKAGAGSCLSYDGKIYLTFTRKIHEATFERLFFSALVEMGIPVEIESNRIR